MRKKKPISHYQVIIVGAGPAGIGVAAALQDFGIENYLILERNRIGSSFKNWNKDTKLLTPSFQSTQFGLLDLNAIALNTSPAFSAGSEHLNGSQYATYLERVAELCQISIQEQTEVLAVTKMDNLFSCETKTRIYSSDFLIWATGEFQFPQKAPFPGAAHCTHIADILSYDSLKSDDYIVIGGYESGIDTAIQLALRDKQTTVIEQSAIFDKGSQDPSVTLSFYTMQRLAEIAATDNICYAENQQVLSVKKTGGKYFVQTTEGYYSNANPPLLATGYLGGEHQIKNLFHWKDDRVLLSTTDESTKTPGLFLTGPHVKHNHVNFCFIYKFRQRFAIIAHVMAERIGIDDREAVTHYKKSNMYLEDLSCCTEDCRC